jgi:dipeptidyl aminopeptidase/acylaminoacyl peptidase
MVIRTTARAMALACCLLAAGSAFAAPAKKAAAPKLYTIEQFMATTSYNGASFSKDEKQLLVNSNETGIYNAYAIPVAGGKAVPMTKSTVDSTYGVDYFYNDDRILFTRDKGGNEQNHLFVRELDGTEKDLTPGDKLKASFEGWQPDGNAFYVSTNERDPKMFDLYRYDAKTYARTVVYENKSGMNATAISRDGKWLALSKPNTTNDVDVYLYEVATKTARHITPHDKAAAYNAATFDPESKRLFLTSNADGEFAAIYTYDLASGKMALHEKADWDMVGTGYSRDGRYRISAVNQDASSVVRIVEGPDERPVPLPKTPSGELRNVTFSPSGRLMAFYVNGDRSPNNLFVHDFKTKQTRQLTQSLSKEINPEDLVDTEIVRFKSFDGTVIPSVFYRPKGASATSKAPAVVFVHGGPGGQTRRGYSALIQYLVNHGYAVLGINNRGSSGYGKTFFAADDRKHGREPLWDCIEAKTYLASLGYIDPQRIGIMGGSYGGYMVLSAMAFRPEAFKAGIDIFGVSNWIRTLESIPSYWEDQRKALYDEIGDPVKEKAFLTATSPLFHAKEIRMPLMVIQGANDPRVIKPESDEIVEAVRKNNVPVEYVLFADEGHGFSKKKNQAEANAKMLQFLDKYLKP